MAIGTFAELKTAMANWLHRVDLTDRIPEFIEGGMQRINLELMKRGGIPDQEQIAYASTVADQETLALPSDFAGLRWIKLDDSSSTPTDPIELMDYNQMLDRYGVITGVPEKCAIMDESFYFRPIPDAVYTVRICYLKRYASFSGASDTNYLLTKGGNVLLYASLLEATGFIDDDRRIAMWGQGYKEAMENLRIGARKARGTRPREVQFDNALLSVGGNGIGYDIETDS